jgi:hypothetical protein
MRILSNFIVGILSGFVISPGVGLITSKIYDLDKTNSTHKLSLNLFKIISETKTILAWREYNQLNTKNIESIQIKLDLIKKTDTNKTISLHEYNQLRIEYDKMIQTRDKRRQDLRNQMKQEQDAVSNSNYPFQTLSSLYPLEMKRIALGAVIGAPIGEELVFRSIIQDKLGKKFMGRFFCSASRGSIAARVLFTSILFSGAHAIGNLAPAYQELQVRDAFITSIALGLIKESRLGLAGAIGSHATANALAVYALWRFSPRAKNKTEINEP